MAVEATTSSPTAALPTGTVTYLFTDIEGSTRLVEELGDAAWRPLLERHRAILRAALAGRGVEIQTEGDGLFAVFERAPVAVLAAAEAQRALGAEAWPANAPIRVRMGLHTGEGTLDADGAYVGADVHRAARIAGASHGGQVVLSDTTRALVASSLPKGVTLVDLGEHRLKDLRPQRLSQLRIDGIPSDFPSIRSLDVRPNNLPTVLTSFVGRDKELAAAADLLARTRLLTLSGPGGTGKTRLSLQLAAATSDRFPDGIWFVPLEPIRDPALVAATIAHVLGIAISNRPDVEQIIAMVGTKRMLFVLDNFEQVIDAAPLVPQLLRACPELRIIVTSRAVLRVSGEQDYPVPGLPAPPDVSRLSQLEFENLTASQRQPAIDALNQYEAVRLFIARALAVRPSFAVTNENAPAVAQICARLSGMPLAIELAAARARLLTPPQILSRLEHQLDLLTSGSRDLPERQQTLRGAIAWSYDLLEDKTRTFFDRLSIFSGGFDLEAAEAVPGTAEELGFDVLEGLSSLVDQSLVRREEAHGEIRFDLFPTIREFALEHLEARGELAAMSERYARHYLALAEAAAPELSGARQREWLDRLESEHDNLRAAISWATDRPEPEIAIHLGFALWRFWQQRGYLQEARMRLARIAGMSWTIPPELRGKLYEALGGIAYWQADHPAAIAAYDSALAAWREVGDEREIANALYNRSFADILPEINRTPTPALVSDPVKAVQRCDEALALFREAGDRVGEGNILWARGSILYFQKRTAEALPWFRQALDVFREVGQRTMEAWTQHMLAVTLLKEGETTSAAEADRAALRHFHAAGDLAGVTLVLDDLSAIAATEGELERAGLLHGAARKLELKTGAQLANYVEEMFEQANRPNVRTALKREELERHSAAGAAMTLDEAVAYALGASLPDEQSS